MKKNLSLFIALSLPILMVVAIAISVYASKASVRPEHNFVYSIKDGYNQVYYEMKVVEGRLQKNIPTLSQYEAELPLVEPELYLYDIKANSAERISFEHAAQLSLSDERQSPDGYTIDQGGSGGFLFYSGSNYDTVYIKSDSGAGALNIDLSDFGYYNFNFIGWVLE